MWEFLSSHPWWGLIYLLIVCLTATISCMGLGAAIGARRKTAYEDYLARKKSDGDVVH